MSNWTPDQKSAIEKSGSNIIVSAGAGSGKTAVLSERVIEKLNNNININELLILTFTSAAASEMKDRIRRKISKNPLFKKQLDLIDSSYITTFDSFALSVVKKYHYLLNIPKDVSITDESFVKIKQKLIIDDIFENRYKNHDTNFEDLINKYCVKSDNYLRSIILNIANKIDSFIDKYDYVNYIKNEFYSDTNINDLLKEYRELIENKKKTVKLEFKNLEYYFNDDYVQDIKACISNIMNVSVDNLHLYDKISLPRIPRNSSDEQKELKKCLQDALNELTYYSSFGTIEDIKNNIMFSKPYVNTILDLVLEYIETLKKYKEENNIYTFNDIASLAIKIVSENKDARDELKYSFKEIMIDEYQDTNDIQDIFINYIANDNVYMVGDIKQSIYRFRGSNPNIFKNKYEKYSHNEGGIKIDLIKNFRSRNEVLNNINRIFELLMDFEIGGAEYKKSHEMVYGNTTYDLNYEKDFKYGIDILEYNNTTEKEYKDIEIEIFTIANDIKNKINSKMQVVDKDTNKPRTIRYDDIAIICDRSKYFVEFKRIFEYVGIPLLVLKDDKLNDNIDISIIKNILDLIIRIQNNDFGVDYKYDILSIGRSFLYELSDQYLFDVIKNNKLTDNIIYNDFKNIDSLNSKTSAMILEEILDITDFYNKINKIGGYESINERLKIIYKVANDLTKLNYDINDFKEYLDTILKEGIDINYNPFTTNANCVKILTIHKSKGLEYPICYYADLNHKFNLSDLNELFVVDKKYGIIIPTLLENNDKSVLKEIYKNNYMQEEIGEKIRLFYVALTRAREKIIIVLPNKEEKEFEKNDDGVIEKIRRLKFNKLSDFIYAIKYYHKDYFSSIDLPKLNLTKNYLYNKNLSINLNNDIGNINVNEINIDMQLEEEKHFSKENNVLITFANKKNMDFGTLIHEVFELIDLKNYDENIIEDNFIREKVSKFMNNKLLENIKKSNVYHEYEFLYEDKDILYHGIIDLMLEYSDHIDIIDFKLKNITDKNYKNQLMGYKKYIETMSNKKVNTYLYSIIDEKFTKMN